MVRRTRYELYHDVLKAINTGIEKPTRIMYKANLTYDNLQKIFSTLIENGFIREEYKGDTKRYYITTRGKKAITQDAKRSLLPFVSLRG